MTQELELQIQQFVRSHRFQGAPSFRMEYLNGGLGMCMIVMHSLVEDVDNPGNMIWVQVGERLQVDRSSWRDQVRHAFRSLYMKLAEHEFEERLRFDDQPVHDPHNVRRGQR